MNAQAMQRHHNSFLLTFETTTGQDRSLAIDQLAAAIAPFAPSALRTADAPQHQRAGATMLPRNCPFWTLC
jgi:hypothetical protein